MLVVGCDEPDVVAIRILMADHSRGTIVTHCLQAPSEQGPVELATSGVVWQNRINLVCASGEFENIARLKVQDISFTGGQAPDNSGYIQVHLPRGVAARWPKIVVDATSDQLEQAADTFAPSRNLNLGSTLTILVQLPGHLVAQGTKPELRGVKTSVDDLEGEPDKTKAVDRVVMLTVPLATAQKGEGSLVWHVMWQK